MLFDSIFLHREFFWLPMDAAPATKRLLIRAFSCELRSSFEVRDKNTTLSSTAPKKVVTGATAMLGPMVGRALRGCLASEPIRLAWKLILLLWKIHPSRLRKHTQR